MTKDAQVKGLFSAMSQNKCLSKAALKADMSEQTARKYLRLGSLPSENKPLHDWPTREDPFKEAWEEIEGLLSREPGLQAKTVFEHLQRKYPGVFPVGRLRTLQRRFRRWRATHGEGQEVFFPQDHHPGILCASDFTDMTALAVTLLGQPFKHMVYHFVLTYSNWEDATLCFSESFESLSRGLQNALWRCGGCPEKHRTDSLTAAVNNLTEDKDFTARYQGLLSHYRMQGHHTNPGHGNENGDVELRHRRFKETVDQALMIRGNRDFASREAYESFLRILLDRLNRDRAAKYLEEQSLFHPLPHCRLVDYREILKVPVTCHSTVRILRNVYSVHSRLIGYHVTARVHHERIDVFNGSDCVVTLPRLQGRGQHRINYRHVIDWLVRKPGAFAQYKYHSDLFPTSHFRIAYDMLCKEAPARASKEYLAILYHAAMESETLVNEALQQIIREGRVPEICEVKALVLILGQTGMPTFHEPDISPVSLTDYDRLLLNEEVAQ